MLAQRMMVGKDKGLGVEDMLFGEIKAAVLAILC
jgi:hypothetical protein